jgi:hypothetical protein
MTTGGELDGTINEVMERLLSQSKSTSSPIWQRRQSTITLLWVCQSNEVIL